MKIMKLTIGKKTGAIIAIVLVLIIVAAFFIFRSKTTVVKPKIGPVTESVYAIGIVTSDYNYNLKPSVNAVIEKFYIMEGQKVRKGDPLMRTDTGITFYAPFNGIISKRYNEQGEITMPGQPVLTLLDPVRTHVIVTLDQQSAVRVRVKQTCELSFENMRQKKFKGVIDRIYPSNTQFIAWIIAPDLPPEVLVGMSADVAIQVVHRENALLIPADSLRDGIVTVVRNRKKMKLRVKTGTVNKNWIEVLDGKIEANDGIIAPRT